MQSFPFRASLVSQHSSSRSVLDSPPSLGFSDISSEELNHEIELLMEQLDVSQVMQKVLGYLNGIAEHLRSKDENEAANEIAKQTINIVNTFMGVTAAWDIDKCIMAVPQPITTPTPAQQEARRRVAEGSWASVAATETSPSNTLVKFHPSDAITRAVVEPTIDVSANDLRVVWLLSWPAARPLSAATKQLNDYGALLSVAHVPDSEAVCIIFQRTHQAQAFLGGNEKRKAATGTGLFGPAVEVIQGDPYPTNDDLRAMDMPFNERRRLTFARSALFTAQNGLTEAIFKQDIHALVGEHNVELVWLFNSGNATVIFTATSIARIVRNTFLQRGMKAGPYKDVHVSFSHDPCERPLHLVSQMSNGLSNGQAMRSRNPNLMRLGNTRQERGQNGRLTRDIDDDGWHTVHRRR